MYTLLLLLSSLTFTSPAPVGSGIDPDGLFAGSAMDPNGKDAGARIDDNG